MQRELNQMLSDELKASMWLFSPEIPITELSENIKKILLLESTKTTDDHNYSTHTSQDEQLGKLGQLEQLEQLEKLKKEVRIWYDTYQSFSLVQEIIMFYYFSPNVFTKKIYGKTFSTTDPSTLNRYNIYSEMNAKADLTAEQTILLDTIEKIRSRKAVILLKEELFPTDINTDSLANNLVKLIIENCSQQMGKQKIIIRFPDTYIYCFAFYSIEEKNYYEELTLAAFKLAKEIILHETEEAKDNGMEIEFIDSETITTIKYPSKYTEITNLSLERSATIKEYFKKLTNDTEHSKRYRELDFNLFTELFGFVIDTTQGRLANKIEEFFNRIERAELISLHLDSKKNNEELVLVWLVFFEEIEKYSNSLRANVLTTSKLLYQCMALLALMTLETGIEVYFPDPTAIAKDYYNYIKKIVNPLSMMPIYEQIEIVRKFPLAYILEINGILSFCVQIVQKKQSKTFLAITGYLVSISDFSKIKKISKTNMNQLFPINEIMVQSLLPLGNFRTSETTISEENERLKLLANKYKDSITKIFTELEEVLDISTPLNIFNTMYLKHKDKEYYVVIEDYNYITQGVNIPHDNQLLQLTTMLNKEQLFNAIPISEIEPLADTFLKKSKEQAKAILTKESMPKHLYKNTNEIKNKKHPLYYRLLKLILDNFNESLRESEILDIDKYFTENKKIPVNELRESVFNLDFKKLRKSPSSTIFGFHTDSIIVNNGVMKNDKETLMSMIERKGL